MSAAQQQRPGKRDETTADLAEPTPPKSTDWLKWLGVVVAVAAILMVAGSLRKWLRGR